MTHRIVAQRLLVPCGLILAGLVACGPDRPAGTGGPAGSAAAAASAPEGAPGGAADSAGSTGQPGALAPLRPGFGVHIWTFGEHADPPEVVAARAAQLGVSFVLIKAGEDDRFWDWNLNPSMVSLFNAVGVDVYAWFYVRPGNIGPKVDAIARQSNLPGVKGMLLDVEWEWFGYGADAVALCQGIRQRTPGKFLGYTAEFNYPDANTQLGTPVYFSRFPWREFDSNCGDAFLPQVYWDEFYDNRDIRAAWSFTVQGARSLGLKAPIWPIQDFDDNASVADLDAFFQLTGPGASLWRWPDPGSPLLQTVEQINWRGVQGAGLGTCQSQGFWCGSSPGAPAGGNPSFLYYCPGAGAEWQERGQCTSCFTCPDGVADTCDASIAAAKGCHDASGSAFGTCSSFGYWCGQAPGAPAGARPDSLYYCAGPGSRWHAVQSCGHCYQCPPSVRDTCDAAAAAAQGCH
jgi:hypothetical protein